MSLLHVQFPRRQPEAHRTDCSKPRTKRYRRPAVIQDAYDVATRRDLILALHPETEPTDWHQHLDSIDLTCWCMCAVRSEPYTKAQLMTLGRHHLHNSLSDALRNLDLSQMRSGKLAELAADANDTTLIEALEAIHAATATLRQAQMQLIPDPSRALPSPAAGSTESDALAAQKTLRENGSD
ncbi:hypothetical protein [Micromonospora sp. WMMD1155]|uniref:hypothetical protein n=1 Tax=Micromonospora sp. WMMD1155 TaxID=3016094 RepID=UPI00249C3D3F|nr:hypothetical protein [Micromonospora sp. WMMD1155]WFE53010.1 hypothetical protein O7617_23015 [Micromonospora sp. WMMD1155]